MKLLCLAAILCGISSALVLKGEPDSFVQVASKVATKGDGFDGFGAPDPFNQNDDDQVDQGEPNAPDAENPNEDANMVSDDEEDEDDSFVQVASKVAKKGDGFDGFGAPDPFNQNDDDQVDQGEPNAPDAENPNEDANMVSDDEEDEDDSFVQVASKVAKKGDGFDGFGAPDPFNQNDDDQVDQGEPNAPDAENPNEDANMVSDDEEDDDDSFVQVASKVAKKGDGFDGFGAPDPFNQNDDDQVDQGEPNAPDAENPNEDANMVSGDEEDDDDAFVQVASKVAKKGDGFDGFGAPDPFNQNDDDQVDQGEPNAPDSENPNEDANMVSDDEEDDDDSFVQVASKVAKKGDGFDGFGAPDPFNQNDDDQVDQGEPNAPDAENPNEDANMVSDDEEDDDDSFVQVASKVTKKGDGFDGFGAPDPFNQNDDDQVDQGEPNAPDAENPNEDANMVSDDEEDDDDSFVQVASKVAKKGDGFDGFGAPDPFNQNDDDQVDQGEPNAPDAENPNEDANMVSDGEEDDDDSFVQLASKVAKKGDGFDGFGAPDPFNQNDDDQVDQGEPNAPDAENPNEDANMVSDDDEDDEDSFVQVASNATKKAKFLAK